MQAEVERSALVRPGGRIAVVAPSGAFDAVKLDAGLEVLQSWGYHPTLMHGVGQRWRYLAGTDDTRLHDLNAALSGDWDAVWMVRGGFGMSRLLGRVDWERTKGMPFLGFSDGTAFLNAYAERRGAAIHGPVLTSLGALADEESREHLRRLLAGESTEPLPGRALFSGHAEGRLCGGNVCVLASLCGTRWQLRTKGHIVLLEDVGEAPYKLDRLLTQIIDAGCFDGAAGFVLGSFLGADPPEGAEWATLDVLRDLLRPFGVPVLCEVPIGHGPRNLAVPFAEAHIDGDLLHLGGVS